MSSGFLVTVRDGGHSAGCWCEELLARGPCGRVFSRKPRPGVPRGTPPATAGEDRWWRGRPDTGHRPGAALAAFT